MEIYVEKIIDEKIYGANFYVYLFLGHRKTRNEIFAKNFYGVKILSAKILT